MRLSASRLNTWMECQAKAKFRYVERLPEPRSAAAVFGTMTHTGLEDLNNGVPVEVVVENFKKSWDNPPENQVPQVWPRRSSAKQYRDAGIEALTRYAANTDWNRKQVLGTEVEFLVPIGRHWLHGFIDELSVTGGRKGKSLAVIDHKTNKKKPYANQLRLNQQFCADVATEILTEDGWRPHGSLIPGQRVMTLNPETGQAEWQPLLDVHVFDVNQGQLLVHMQGQGHSSVTTANHRWLAERYVQSTGDWRQEVVTSDSVSAAHRIRCAAPVSNLPTEPKYTDAIVELVGWYWTEGAWLPGNQGTIIGQSKSNEAYAERIRTALQGEFGDPVTGTLDPHRGIPAWRETYSPADNLYRFHINGVAAGVLKECAPSPEKVLAPRFLAALTASQLDLLIDVSIWADGWEQRGTRHIGQADRQRLDAFQMACSLAGIRTTLREKTIGSGPYAGRPHFVLTLLERRPYFYTSQREGGFRISREAGTGQVWCPRTENQTWLARREGTVYFTGNTIYHYAVNHEDFWTGQPPEVVAEVFPELGPDELPQITGPVNGAFHREMTKDLPIVLLWHHVMNATTADCGPRTMEDYERLLFAIEQIEKAIAADAYVPNISGDTCGFCPFTKQCGVPLDDLLNYNPSLDDN